jgi:hypothetical protein
VAIMAVIAFIATWVIKLIVVIMVIRFLVVTMAFWL